MKYKRVSIESLGYELPPVVVYQLEFVVRSVLTKLNCQPVLA